MTRKEKQLEKVVQVNELRKQGTVVAEACKKVGLSYSAYQYHNGKKGKTRSKLVTLPQVAPKERLMVLIGSPEEVSQAIRSFL